MVAEVRRLRVSDRTGHEGSFTDRLNKLAASIDYRRADSKEERDAIFRLRYDAYTREGGIATNAEKMFSDSYDDTDNAYIFGLYIEGELATSIRLHIASKRQNPDFPSLKVFPDFLRPELDAGKVLLDTTRFVTAEKFSRTHRGLPFVTVRMCVLAAQHFGADHVLAAVRAEHQAWYARSFGLRVVCEPRPYPQLAKPISLMTVDFPSVREEWYRRYPFFRSSPLERRHFFDRRSQASSADQQPATTRAPIEAKVPSGPFFERGAA
jgi:N-acyl-L-homoserine lactone synthetase